MVKERVTYVREHRPVEKEFVVSVGVWVRVGVGVGRVFDFAAPACAPSRHPPPHPTITPPCLRWRRAPPAWSARRPRGAPPSTWAHRSAWSARPPPARPATERRQRRTSPALPATPPPPTHTQPTKSRVHPAYRPSPPPRQFTGAVPQPQPPPPPPLHACALLAPRLPDPLCVLQDARVSCGSAPACTASAALAAGAAPRWRLAQFAPSLSLQCQPEGQRGPASGGQATPSSPIT